MLIPEPARLLGHLRKMCRSSDGLYWNGEHSDLHPVLYVMGLVAGRIRPDVIQEITPGYFRPSDWLSVRLILAVTRGVLSWFVSLITPHHQPMQPVGKPLPDSFSEVPARPEKPRVGRFCGLLV